MPRFYETTLSITNLHNLSISTHVNCSRIYCGDFPEYSKYEQKTFWEFGNGLFPDVELNALFEQTGIGQSRQNRRDMPVPNNAGEIDKFFQK